jgi:hypothetical protein
VLGVVLDNHLKFNIHIKKLLNKIRSGLYILSKAKSMVSTKFLIQLYYAFIHSHLSYAIEVWGCTYNTSLKSILILQNRALRIITSTHPRINVDEIYAELKIFNVFNLIRYRLNILVFDIKNNYKTIPNLKIQEHNLGSLRSANRHLLIPQSIHNNYGKFHFNYFAVKLWNEIQLDIRALDNRHDFMIAIKNNIMDKFVSQESCLLLCG